ncbi:alpha/beta hydrolase [Halovivax sp.]|uniref:alpha/beta hydrolase n=1 Tax=Halovivax sp. TaxID=1935978 RepID=UPI0025C0DAD3|nr:alpha/beta hydrolase [Halovivax sp.]
MDDRSEAGVGVDGTGRDAPPADEAPDGAATADELDPELAAVVEEIEAAGVPPWHAMSVESARRIEDEVFSAGEGPELRTVRDLRIDGPGGELPIRVYRPDAENPPTLVFCHGGGWTLGTLDSADDICRELAARGECLVLSVDYRLAPEHPFPAAVDDAYAALEWASGYAGDLGGDPDRLGVAGTSAGGNLAAATALRVRDGATDDLGGDAPALAGQFLLYPMTDRRFDRDAYREHGGGPLLTEADVRWFWDQYLRSPVDEHNPYATVLRAPDLSGVAPATVLTAGFDVLRDEGAAYAAKLADRGVPVDHDHYPTLSHGFLSLTDDVERADAAMDGLAERIRARLG